MRVFDADGREILTRDPDRLRARIEAGDVAAVLVARLDRLPEWIRADVAALERRGVAIVATAEGIDTDAADGWAKLGEALART